MTTPAQTAPDPVTFDDADRVAIKPWLTWTTTDDALIVSHGSGVTVFEGSASTLLLPHLLPLLDGSLTVGEVIAHLGTTIRPAVLAALAELESRELLLPAADSPDDARATDAAVAIAADRLADGPAAVATVLGGSTVHVAGDNLVARELVRQLRLAGVGTVCSLGADAVLPSDGLAVAVADPGDDQLLVRWNEEALASRGRWLPILPYDGRLASIGPVVLPDATACYECLRIRRAANLSFRDERRRYDHADRATARRGGGVVAGPLAYATAAFAAEAVISALLDRGDQPALLSGRVLTLAPTLAGPDVEVHRLYRVPRCPACSRVRGLGHPQIWFDPDIDPTAWEDPDGGHAAAAGGGEDACTSCSC